MGHLILLLQCHRSATTSSFHDYDDDNDNGDNDDARNMERKKTELASSEEGPLRPLLLVL